jgi:hypothetical protein
MRSCQSIGMESSLRSGFGGSGRGQPSRFTGSNIAPETRCAMERRSARARDSRRASAARLLRIRLIVLDRERARHNIEVVATAIAEMTAEYERQIAELGSLKSDPVQRDTAESGSSLLVTHDRAFRPHSRGLQRRASDGAKHRGDECRR